MPEDSAPESRFRSIGEIAQDMLSGMQKCCSPASGYGKEIDGRRGVTSTRDGLTETRLIGASEMTALPNDTGVHAPDQSEHDSNWRSLGSLAGRLKAEIEAAIATRDEEAGAESHAALIDLEHQERLAETVRRYSR